MKSGPRLFRDDDAGGTLRRIAEALGVPVEAFAGPGKVHVLHTAPDGTRWVLLGDAQGNPVVRRIGNPDAGTSPVDEGVSAFLARDGGSPQHEALSALIDRLLMTHLTG